MAGARFNAVCQSGARDTLPKADSNFIILEKDGNLVMQVRKVSSNVSKSFLVNRDALCQSSPVFQAMLGKDSKFLEANSYRRSFWKLNNQEKQTVAFEENSHFAMTTYLQAIHPQTEAPGKVTFDELHEIAVLCDKYILYQALSSYLRAWLEPHVSNPLVQNGSERWVLISRTFKLPDVYTTVTQNLLMGCRPSLTGELQFEGRSLVSALPESTYQDLHNHRHEILLGLSETIEEQINSLVRVKGCSNPDGDPSLEPQGNRYGYSRYEPGPRDSEEFSSLCSIIQLGFLQVHFASLNVEDSNLTDKGPNDFDYRSRKSLSELRVAVYKLRRENRTSAFHCSDQFKREHGICSTGSRFWDHMDYTIDKIPGLTLDDQ